MTALSLVRILLPALLAALYGCGQDGAGESAATVAAGQDRMSIAELYSRPSLIGTSPELPVWSRDGGRLAFAWNDEGLPFRDLWLYTPPTADLRRLTHHGDEAGEGRRGDGVEEVLWLGAGDEALAYVIDGALYLVEPSGESRRAGGRFRGVRDLRVSPDGKFLSFAAASSAGGDDDRRDALWLAPVENGRLGTVERLVDAGVGRIRIESHEWSKGGSHIAFVHADDTEVSEREIHYYADGGELQVDRVTRAFPGEATTRRSLGVVALADRAVRWFELQDERYPIWGYGLSSDGSRLFANTSDFVVKEHTIYVFDVATAERETFYRFEDPRNVIPGWQAAWAPGDEGLIVLTDRHGYYHLYHQREAGGAPRALTSGSWEVASFEVDAERDRIWFVANRSHPSERQVYSVGTDGGEIDRLTTEPGTWEPVFSPDHSRVALRFSNDTTPPDLYAAEAPAGDIRRITHSPGPEFDNYNWATVTYPEFTSHVDGTKLYGRLSVPPDFDASRRYPLIVGSVYADSVRNQWGGRTAHPTWGLDQYLVSRGYLILNVNVRGSWGHGKEFSQGLLRDYGGIDIEDIESGVRYLIDQGNVDPVRVGIWGSSYGGLMTLMSLFKKPELYAAGIAGAPATNVWHAFPSQMWVMGEPRGDDYPERYRRQSPLFHHEGLEDPLMIIHGTKDRVVLYSDTIALVERLIGDGKQFELVTLPGGSHGWDIDNLEQTQFAFRKMAYFFDRHLK